MKLPKNKFETVIKDMEVDTYGWTVPWAMFPDENGELWLNGNYPVCEYPGGTVRMGIGKTSTGVIVDISKCEDYKWSRGVPCFVGGFIPLPVEDLRT